jgi:hypothetical protein
VDVIVAGGGNSRASMAPFFQDGQVLDDVDPDQSSLTHGSHGSDTDHQKASLPVTGSGLQ